MTEREEYTPSMDHVRNMYARTIRPDGIVALWSRRQKEFDRWIAAHDRALREQIAEEIEHKREVLSEAQLRILGHLPPVQSGIVAGYTYAARIARGEGSE